MLLSLSLWRFVVVAAVEAAAVTVARAVLVVLSLSLFLLFFVAVVVELHGMQQNQAIPAQKYTCYSQSGTSHPTCLGSFRCE